jgi:hypothetical protein
MMFRWFLLAIALMTAAPANAQDHGVSAELAPPKGSAIEITPAPSENGLPGLQCDDHYCGFASLRDLWKLDRPRPAQPDDMSTESVIIERSNRLAEAKRWADSPPVFQVAIPGTNCGSGGYTADDLFGIRCGGQHRKFDPGFVCVDRKSCTPTEEHHDDRP